MKRPGFSLRFAVAWPTVALCGLLSLSPCDPFSSDTPSGFFNPRLIREETPFDLIYWDETGLAAILGAGQPYDIENILEWKNRFCDYPDTSDIRYVLYQSGIDELEWMKKAIGSKGLSLGSGFAGNTFAEALYVNKCTETIDYLIFAKECEPYVLGPTDWQPMQRDTARMTGLIRKGIRILLKEKSNFLRLRYAYQVIRLSHYKKDYKGTIALCDYLFPKVDASDSIVWYWIYGHQAGALRALGQNAASARLYATVFLHCQGKRASALRSLRITTDAEWQEALAACHSDAERTALHAMRGSGPHAKSLEDMQAIYALDPASTFLPLLLLRETSRIERLALKTKEPYAQKPSGRGGNELGDYLVQVIGFTTEVLHDNQVIHVEVWRTCLAYLHLLAGNTYEAANAIALARPYAKDHTAIAEQLQVFDMALRITGFQDVGHDAAADSIASLRKSDLFFEYPQFTDMWENKLALLYESAGNRGMAFLARHSLKELSMNPDPDLLDDLIAVCKKEKNNQLERSFIAKSNGETILNELLDIKGTYYLGQGQIEAALTAFQQIPRTAKPSGQFNPFRDRIRDCVNCSYADSVLLTKEEVARKILDLEFQAKAALEEGAVYYFQIGLAYYNLSYFGQSPQTADFYRSGINWTRIGKGPVFAIRNSTVRNRENLDLSKALDAFEKARQLAKDPELAARAAFWGAKCELATFYTSHDNTYKTGSKFIPNIPARYRNYYTLLKQRYAQTEFYRLAIKECRFFEAYAR